MKKPRQHIEHEIQCAGIAECRKIPGCKWIHAVPNAMPGDIRAQVWMNKEGRLKGISDVFLPHPRMSDEQYDSRGPRIIFYGLYIEVKKPDTFANGKKSPAGKLKEEQARFILYADKAGYAVSVVDSAQQMIDTCLRYVRGEHSNDAAVRMAEERLK